jgi:hypothetical protein
MSSGWGRCRAIVPSFALLLVPPLAAVGTIGAPSPAFGAGIVYWSGSFAMTVTHNDTITPPDGGGVSYQTSVTHQISGHLDTPATHPRGSVPGQSVSTFTADQYTGSSHSPNVGSSSLSVVAG